MQVRRAWRDPARCSFVFELSLNPDLHSKYGAPTTVHINTTISAASPARGSAEGPHTKDRAGLTIATELLLFNKSATRLPESMFFSYDIKPEPRMAAAAATSGHWTASKLGGTVDLRDVLQNGSQFQHGQWDGVRHVFARGTAAAADQNPEGRHEGMGNESMPVGGSATGASAAGWSAIELASDDVAVVSPHYPARPTPFPASPRFGMRPLTEARIGGISFCLMTNVYNTNYPLWYPFVEADASMRFRFAATFLG